LVATQRPFPSRNGDIIGQKRDDRSPQLGEHTDAARLSTIPVTKNDSEHIVPLSDTALAVLTEIGLEPGEPVFPNNRGGLLSATAMAAVIRRMNEERKREGKPQWIDPKQGYRQVLPHGFRATFRTLVHEQTNFSRELGEKALPTRSTTRRSAAISAANCSPKRKRLVDAWAAHCAQVKAPAANNVTQLRKIAGKISMWNINTYDNEAKRHQQDGSARVYGRYPAQSRFTVVSLRHS
jgi:hypothetical protein